MQWQKELTIQEVLGSIKHRQLAVPKLCQNPICLGCRELQFEREQLPQVVDNKHFRMERMEHLEPVIVLRNQQVAGSIPAGGSIKSVSYRLIWCDCWGLGSNPGSNQRFCNRVAREQFVHLIGRIPLRFPVDVLVHVLREPDVRVPDDFRDDLQRDALGTQ